MKNSALATVPASPAAAPIPAFIQRDQAAEYLFGNNRHLTIRKGGVELKLTPDDLCDLRDFVLLFDNGGGD